MPTQNKTTSHSEKACVFVLRHHDNRPQVLAFRHPEAGKQWIKGTVEPSEDHHASARRELTEESGLIAPTQLMHIGSINMKNPNAKWHLYACASESLPNQWDHDTVDDHGHTFHFFWHPLDAPLDDGWHRQFHAPFAALQAALQDNTWPDAHARQVIP